MKELNTILGGATLTVNKLDGTNETLTVLQLPIKKYPAYLAAIDDEIKMIELLCDRPAGFAETLTLESSELVITTGETLNADFFWRWARRRTERQEKFMPGLTDKLIAATALKDTSPTSPSAPASPSRKPAATA